MMVSPLLVPPSLLTGTVNLSLSLFARNRDGQTISITVCKSLPMCPYWGLHLIYSLSLPFISVSSEVSDRIGTLNNTAWRDPRRLLLCFRHLLPVNQFENPKVCQHSNLNFISRGSRPENKLGDPRRQLKTGLSREEAAQ